MTGGQRVPDISLGAARLRLRKMSSLLYNRVISSRAVSSFWDPFLCGSRPASESRFTGVLTSVHVLARPDRVSTFFTHPGTLICILFDPRTVLFTHIICITATSGQETGFGSVRRARAALQATSCDNMPMLLWASAACGRVVKLSGGEDENEWLTVNSKPWILPLF